MDREQQLETLEFYAEDHSYRVAGVQLPSVTTVLGDQFPLYIPPDRLRFARALGIAIHRATALYDQGTLDIDTLDTKIVPFLRAWIKFREQTRCVIVEIEHAVMHPVLRYAGTLDRIIFMDGERGVLDLKKPLLTARVGVQLAGYERAYNEQLGKKRRSQHCTARWGLQLRNDESYRLRRYSDSSDFSIFVSSLNIFNWKALHKEI